MHARARTHAHTHARSLARSHTHPPTHTHTHTPTPTHPHTHALIGSGTAPAPARRREAHRHARTHARKQATDLACEGEPKGAHDGAGLDVRRARAVQAVAQPGRVGSSEPRRSEVIVQKGLQRPGRVRRARRLLALCVVVWGRGGRGGRGSAAGRRQPGCLAAAVQSITSKQASKQAPGGQELS